MRFVLIFYALFQTDKYSYVNYCTYLNMFIVRESDVVLENIQKPFPGFNGKKYPHDFSLIPILPLFPITNIPINHRNTVYVMDINIQNYVQSSCESLERRLITDSFPITESFRMRAS